VSDNRKSPAASASRTHPQTDEVGSRESLSPNEIGEELGVTGVAVKQWIYQHRLQANKLANGYWRVSRENLNRFLADRKVGAKRRIMLVGTGAAAFRNSLVDIGWQPIVAHNPIDAVLRAVDGKPAMTVIDLDSLGEGGWSVADRLRCTRGTLRVPILLLASPKIASDPEAMERSLSMGIQGCITLPTEKDTLIASIRELLGS
jgi:CheY-like chemotaxis protein